MGNTFNPAGGGTYNLNSSIGSIDTIITLSSFLEPVSGVPYTMALLNTSIAFATIAPRTSSSEFISFTGITQNADGTATLTGVTRGLAKKYPFTTSSVFKLPHSGQSVFILSDAPQVFAEYATLINDETFLGQITFAIPPIGVNPGGAPNASTSIQGLVQETTVSQLNAGTSTGAILFPSPADLAASIYGLQLPTANQKLALVGNNTDVAVGSGNLYMTQTGSIHGAEKYATTTGSANAYVATLSPVPTSLTSGMTLTLIANFTNSGAATLAVNSLGSTPAITKAGTTALASGDIVSGQAFTVVWDGTRWQLQNPNIPTSITVQSQIYFPQLLEGAAGSTSKITAINPASLNAGIGSSDLYVAQGWNANENTIKKYTRDTNTGAFYSSGVSVQPQTIVQPTGIVRITVLGSTVYAIWDASSGTRTYERYDIGTLANAGAYTFSGTQPTAGSGLDYPIFNDGTFIYISDGATPTTVNKYSVSGTVLTFVSQATFTSFAKVPTWCDGTSVYQFDGVNINKWALAGGARTQIAIGAGTAIGNATNSGSSYAFVGANSTLGFIFNVDYLYSLSTADPTAVAAGRLILTPITKP